RVRAPQRGAVGGAAAVKRLRDHGALGGDDLLRRDRRLLALDQPLEQGAVRRLAVTRHELEPRDRRLRESAPADQALRAGRQAAELALLPRAVELLAPDR